MGMKGIVEGNTKDECWEAFMKVDKKARGSGLERYSPENKQEAYKEMIKNKESGKYELTFLFDN